MINGMLPHIHTIEKCDCIKPAIHSQIFNSLSIVNREDSDAHTDCNSYSKLTAYGPYSRNIYNATSVITD